MKNDMICTYL